MTTQPNEPTQPIQPKTLKKSWMKEHLADSSSLESEVLGLFKIANKELLEFFFTGLFSDSLEHGTPVEIDFTKELVERGIGAVKLQEHLGSGEGSENDLWTVWGFFRGYDKTYVKFHGFYTSYDGLECQGFKLVEPKQKVITVYE